MRIKKIMIVLMLIIAIAIPVNAVTNYEVGLKADNTQVKQGDTVKITVSLKNINVNAGLGAFVGKLTYDKDVFETVEQSDVVGATGWGTVLYNPDGGYLAVERAAGDGVKENNDVMVVTLKVKQNATLKKGQVSLSEISCSTGEEDLEAANVKVEISVTEKEVPSSGNNNVVNNTVSGSADTNTVENTTVNNVANNTVTNSTSNKVTNTATNKTTNTNTNKVEKTPATSLPHAGASEYIMPAIIITLLAASISYIHYRKIKDIK